MESNYKSYKFSVSNEITPLEVIKAFTCLENYKDEVKFEYSIYINGEPGFGEPLSRKICHCNTINTLSQTLNKTLSLLNKNEELAIHSTVVIDKKKMHIPFIDFIESDEKEIIKAISALQIKFNYDVYLFNSGRSFHAYIDLSLIHI